MLIQFRIFLNISSSSLQENRAAEAPNMTILIDWFNNTSAKFSGLVVQVKHMKDRVKVIETLIEIAVALSQIQNYNGLMEVW